MFEHNSNIDKKVTNPVEGRLLFFGQLTFIEGAPIILTIFINPIGIISGILSFRKTQYKIAKWSIISNNALLTLPFYFFLSTLIFGP